MCTCEIQYTREIGWKPWFLVTVHFAIRNESLPPTGRSGKVSSLSCCELWDHLVAHSLPSIGRATDSLKKLGFLCQKLQGISPCTNLCLPFAPILSSQLQTLLFISLLDFFLPWTRIFASVLFNSASWRYREIPWCFRIQPHDIG